MPQNHVITIQNGDPISGVLTLSDRGQTDVDPNDTVQWNIQPGPENTVAAITSITNDLGSNNVFSPTDQPQPFPLPTSAIWKGSISGTIPPGSQEHYTICWVAKSGVVPPCYDPIIKVNAK